MERRPDDADGQADHAGRRRELGRRDDAML
jgi:hypothetical protein